MQVTKALLALLVVTTGIAVRAATTPGGKNGVRLTSGTASTNTSVNGRLEVKTKEAYFGGTDKKPVWIPVCDVDSDLMINVPQVMCAMLGYKYGRKIYASNVTYNAKNKFVPAKTLYCTKPGKGRRSLSSVHDVVESTGTGRKIAQETQLAQRRSLSPLTGFIVTPKSSPYTCEFQIGECALGGPLVGLECSRTPLLPAPPPPPAPPAPPPAPPPTSQSIHLLGGAVGSWDPIEPNLCPSTAFCDTYGRVEVQVPGPDGSDGFIWAPVCAPSSPQAIYAVAEIACQQVFNWPSRFRAPSLYAYPTYPKTQLDVPTGPVNSTDDFNPENVAGWVTIGNPNVPNATRIQDLNIQVSQTPCTKLLTMSCDLFYA